jgi:hypothetical protein
VDVLLSGLVSYSTARAAGRGGACRRARRPAAAGFRYNSAVTRPATGALVLLVLLAGLPVLASLPNQIGAIRLAGLSLCWWYGGVVVPLLAVLLAVACARGGGRGRPT